jgi:rfaE bifunctional protein kinase chain/domain
VSPIDKIKSIEELASVAASLRAAKRPVVHCHGAFELLHIGAIRLLAQAKKLGDVLMVTVVPDQSGEADHLFEQADRAEAVAALDFVDYVAVACSPQSVDAIQALRPSVYVPIDEEEESEDDRARLREVEQTVVKSVGGVYSPLEVEAVKLSALLHPAPASLPSHAASFLQSFSAAYSPETVLGFLEGIRSKKVLLVGETIIDEYMYCETMGKAGKEPILAVKYTSTERFAGGVLATANQVADFVDHVGIASFLGASDSQEEFIRERLNPKIDATFLYLPGSPTTVKRRFVETYPFQKLFEVYVMNDEIESTYSRALQTRLRTLLPTYDAVIVTDYGHGLITPEIIQLLCGEAKFLAVNTQTNAANQGFNTVSKYPRADYICLSEKELRLEARSRTKDLRLIVTDIAERLSCDRVLVTRGQQGLLCYRKGEGFFPVPALTQRIVDRVGAGDAVLAVTTPCVAQDVPIEVVGVIGSAVGALAVGTVGHRSTVPRSAVMKSISSLLNYKGCP